MNSLDGYLESPLLAKHTLIHAADKREAGGKIRGVIQKNPEKVIDREKILEVLFKTLQADDPLHEDYAIVLISKNERGHVIEGRDEDKAHLQKPIAIVKHHKKSGPKIKQLAPERVTIKTYSDEEFSRMVAMVANNSLKELKSEPTKGEKPKINAVPLPNERRLDRHIPKKEEGNKKQLKQALVIDTIITKSIKDSRKKQELTQKRAEEQNEKNKIINENEINKENIKKEENKHLK